MLACTIICRYNKKHIFLWCYIVSLGAIIRKTMLASQLPTTNKLLLLLLLTNTKQDHMSQKSHDVDDDDDSILSFVAQQFQEFHFHYIKFIILCMHACGSSTFAIHLLER